MEKKKSFKGYLNRLREDKVSDLLLAIACLLPLVQNLWLDGEGCLGYVSLAVIVLDIIWCDMVLYRRKVEFSPAVTKSMKYAARAAWVAVVALVVIAAVRRIMM